MTEREPVFIDGIPVELSAANQKLWDSGSPAKRSAVEEVIRRYREEDGPHFEPEPDDAVSDMVGARHFQDDD